MNDRYRGPSAETNACRHADAAALGFDGDAAFIRCTSCGEILIRQRGRLWAIRPAPSA